jgi:hypothetical protein
MQTAFAPPMGLTVVAIALSALLVAILPTCVYLYVEPRSRLNWASAGDTPKARRAPAMVRATAWLSFVVGELAFAGLVVPVLCGVLLYLQARLGVGRPLGIAATAAIAGAAMLQSLFALGLLPLGVRLLSRDPRLSARAAGVARRNALASLSIIGLIWVLDWSMAAAPGLVHPWLRAALVWTAVRPVLGYAGLCLLHALLLGACARLLVDSKQTEG